MPLQLSRRISDRQTVGSFQAYIRKQSQIARRRLYPLTVFYPAYSFVVTLLTLRSAHL